MNELIPTSSAGFRPAQSGGRATRRLRALLVEDNDDHAVLIELQLSDETPRLDLDRCSSLSQARAQTAGTAYDLVLLDLGLPESTGLHTLEDALTFLGTVPVFVLTSSIDRDIGIQAIAMGAADFVDKHSLENAGLARRIAFAVERADIRTSLEKQNTFLRTFVASVGHDLRAPPRQILQLVERIEEEEAARQAPVRELLSDISSRAEHLSQLLNDTLDYATHASKQPRTSPIKLSDAVGRVVSDLDAAERSRVRLVNDAIVHADPNLLFLMLRNLIGNGLKYWRDRPAHVDVSAQDSQSGTRITVEDDGMGIAPAMLDRVFAPTVRAVDRASFPGTGFGLAIVKLLVEAHGGGITVDSQEGKGTRMTLIFP